MFFTLFRGPGDEVPWSGDPVWFHDESEPTSACPAPGEAVLREVITMSVTTNVPGGRSPVTCRDGLIWLGESGHRYRWFDCESATSCAIGLVPYRGVDHCFLHEAQRRGVSRKISHFAQWLQPGHSRIFLAHHAGLGTPYRGKVFGYFTLERIEFIEHAPESFTEPTRTAGDPSSPGDPGDGESVPGPWPREREVTRPGVDAISELLDTISKYWIERLLTSAFDRRRPTVTKLSDEENSEHRSCSKRTNPGAVYLVDALCAHVDVLPTLIDLCGLEPPADVSFDGTSLAPVLTGKQIALPERTLFVQYRQSTEPPQRAQPGVLHRIPNCIIST